MTVRRLVVRTITAALATLVLVTHPAAATSRPGVPPAVPRGQAPASQPNPGGPAAPASPAAPAARESTPEIKVPITDSDLKRIRQALSSEPALLISDDQLRFYVEVLAKQQTFADFVKGYDLKNGPTKRGNPMTHQEFLTMVTPKELYSSGGITASEMLQFAVTNWLGQTLVRRAIEEIRSAKSEREVQEIRDRINRELAALKGG
ncbi:MAG: hypothetical protein ABI051_12135 [Vicinamibacterales bacterium]